MRSYVQVPCVNYEKCRNTVSRDSSLVKRKIGFRCEECHLEYHREYAREQTKVRRLIQSALEADMDLEGLRRKKEWKYGALYRLIKKKP